MENFKSVDIQNPGHELEPITIENGDSSGIKIIPYHKLEGGTHKMVSCAGMSQRIPEGAQELIESTSGNTGYASAYYAKKIGMPIRVYMPEGMSPKKIKMLEELGANVIET
jgi:threonine dehydratase